MDNRRKKSIEEVSALVRRRAEADALPLATRRTIMNQNISVFPPPSDVRVETADLDGLGAEWLIPHGDRAKASSLLLYFHGGGYIMGSPLSHRHLTAQLARVTGMTVLSVDYALAPESPFPAAVNDGVKAYHWLLRQGYEADTIAISGDSAGGGLAVATLLSARDRNLALPAACALISPWVDLTCGSQTYRSCAQLDPMITPPAIENMAETYLAGADAHHPLASPIFADLRGLPPLLIHVGTNEILLDDSRMLAARARAAGVQVRLDIWNGLFHVWHAFYQMLDEGERAIEAFSGFLHEHFVPD